MASALFATLLQQLSEATTTGNKVLEKIGYQFRYAKDEKGDRWLTNEIQQATQSSNLMQTIANVMQDNMRWAKDLPIWINSTLSVYNQFLWDMPVDQTRSLIDAHVAMLKLCETQRAQDNISCILTPRANKLHFLNETSLYDILRRGAFNKQCLVGAIATATYECIEWQHKVLKDTDLVLHLAQIPDETVWMLLFNLAQHPDAKSLLPREVLEAARTHSFDYCTSVRAILSNESDSISFSLEYIENQTGKLKRLLDVQSTRGTHVSDSLLEIILPLVNLSVMEDNKEILGQHVIGLLLQVISIKESSLLIPEVLNCLQRGRQEAAKTLWNLAFWEANCKRIVDQDGIQTLEQLLKEVDDEALKTNISGILHMLKPQETVQSSPKKQGGHIMLSYNWAHQPTVIRLASSLKALGFKIWLDTEQMKGSTLEAMANAIEGSTLILMCVSQKYKDSPNCRLEGEYCINRNIAFIPLLMQNRYKADGWLGLILGSRRYHNFSSEDNWDSTVAALVNEISTVTQANTTISSEVKLLNVKGPKDWTPEEVVTWLKSESLGQYCELFSKRNVTGKVLLELKEILLSSPIHVHPLIKQIGVLDVVDILTITYAIRQL